MEKSNTGGGANRSGLMLMTKAHTPVLVADFELIIYIRVAVQFEILIETSFRLHP